MLTKRLVAAMMIGSAAISQLAAKCDPPYDPVRFGFVEIDGKAAVFVPMCDGDELRSVVVWRHMSATADVETHVIWDASIPSQQRVRNGLVVLGDTDSFLQTDIAAPTPFPTSIDVTVTTIQGRSFTNGHDLSANLPKYASSVPVERMEFEVAVSPLITERRSYEMLRADFLEVIDQCKKRP